MSFGFGFELNTVYWVEVDVLRHCVFSTALKFLSGHLRTVSHS